MKTPGLKLVPPTDCRLGVELRKAINIFPPATNSMEVVNESLKNEFGRGGWV